jgi:hypothetical protein
MDISDAIFSGEGPLIAPSMLKSDIKHIGFNATRDREKFSLSVDDFSTTSNFQSQSTYATTLKLKKFEWFIKGTKRSDVLMKSSDIYLNASSNVQNEKAEFYVKSSFENLKIKTPLSSFSADDYSFISAINGMDKKSFERLRILISDSRINQSKRLQNKILKESINLLSKGLRFDVADFSLDRFSLKGRKGIKGFKIKGNLVLKEDNNLKGGNNIPIFEILKDITVDAKLQFSNELMAFINEEIPLSNAVEDFAKKDGDNVVFKVKFKDSKLSINGKSLK